MSSYQTGSVKQEMPPQGGYEEIYYRRVPAQRIIGHRSFFIGSSILTLYSLYYYHNRHKHIRRHVVEYNEHVIAVEPLIRAEIDRGFLRQLRHNRNVERDLMKNVPDWEVGTLWGAKVYKTLPENALPNVTLGEYYGHRSFAEQVEYVQPNKDVGLEDTTINSWS